MGQVVDDKEVNNNRRFKNADEVTGQLNQDFNDWCSILTTHSLQASYAIIGANWAVHGTASNILDNSFSKFSMLLIIVFLVLNIFANSWMIHLHHRRFIYAEENTNRWKVEFNQSKGKRYWPYTKLIENLGVVHRFLKTFIPIIAALLFILSLF